MLRPSLKKVKWTSPLRSIYISLFLANLSNIFLQCRRIDGCSIELMLSSVLSFKNCTRIPLSHLCNKVFTINVINTCKYVNYPSTLSANFWCEHQVNAYLNPLGLSVYHICQQICQLSSYQYQEIIYGCEHGVKAYLNPPAQRFFKYCT